MMNLNITKSLNTFVNSKSRIECKISSRINGGVRYYSTPQTMVEKIVQKYASDLPHANYKVRALDYVSVEPYHLMTHDNTSAVMIKFKQFFESKGKDSAKIFNPRQPVFTLDHNVQDTSAANLKKYKSIEEFAKHHNVDFYPAGRGIGHQIMCEEGYAWPTTLVVASDSHSNIYGGLGCLGTPVVRTDAASIWATGKTWWQVPPVAKVELKGKLPEGVTGKDVIIALCGLFNKDEVLNHAVEFTGDGIKSLSVDNRLTIANMTTEWGTLAGVFPVDSVTFNWLHNRAKFLKERDGKDHPRINGNTISQLEKNVVEADKNAVYAKEITLDLSTVRPYISGPNHVKVMQSITDMQAKEVKINKAYIVSCVNSRVDDLAQAAQVLKGNKVAPGVELYVSAASNEVQAESERRGDWQVLVDAGAKTLTPGCGPCIGLGTGLLEDGEVGISATNRNFKGRMGSPNAKAYLASPAVVAASAIRGFIAGPIAFDSVKLNGSIKQENNKPSPVEGSVSVVEGFPKRIEGDIVFCHQDNLNTDGIYPGKYTYREDVSPEQQAQVVMENYDTQFAKLAKKGDILVGGFNFGTGSSREQAATAIKFKGIPLVIAGSFSETYKRNAINNGLLSIEVPDLVNDLKEKFGTNDLTVLTKLKAVVNFEKSIMEANGKVYPISPVGIIAQQLILAGGLENYVMNKLNQS